MSLGAIRTTLLFLCAGTLLVACGPSSVHWDASAGGGAGGWRQDSPGAISEGRKREISRQLDKAGREYEHEKMFSSLPSRSFRNSVSEKENYFASLGNARVELAGTTWLKTRMKAAKGGWREIPCAVELSFFPDGKAVLTDCENRSNEISYRVRGESVRLSDESDSFSSKVFLDLKDNEMSGHYFSHALETDPAMTFVGQEAYQRR